MQRPSTPSSARFIRTGFVLLYVVLIELGKAGIVLFTSTAGIGLGWEQIYKIVDV